MKKGVQFKSCYYSAKGSVHLKSMPLDYEFSSLSQIREKLTDTVVWSAAAFASLTLLSSLSRITEVGFLPVMGLHIGATVYLISLFFARRKCSSEFKAFSVCLIFFCVGAAGVFSLGLAGSGIYLLVGACFYSSFILRIRIAIGFAIAGAVVILTVMGLVWSDNYGFSVEQSLYGLNVASWVTTLTVFAYTVSIGLFLNYHFFYYMRNLIAKQQNQITSQNSRIEHSEAVLQNVINQMPYGVSWKDTQLRYLGTNRVFVEDIGGKPNEDFIGKTDYQVLGKDRAKKFEQMDRKILSGEVKKLSFEEQVENEHGQITYRQINRLPMHDRKKQLIGILVTYHDVTQHKLLEQKAQQALLEAQQASQTKSLFLANMSHEIRTPINGVLGLLDLCLNTDLNPQQRDYLTRADFSAKLLLQILNDVLDLSKIEAGHLALEARTFSFETLLEDIQQMFSEQARKKKLNFTTSFSGATNTHVVGDPTRIFQVITNLVSNAIKFTQQGEVSVKVILVANDTQARVNILVVDSGVGIASKAIPNLFKKFTQADETITREFGGTGLGLSIVKLLVELMGGTIDVKSVEGEGSEFSLKLDLPVGQVSPEFERSVSSARDLTNLNLLLVEDNLINQEVAMTMLSNHGANVTTAANGQQAIDILQEENFDVVLMDVQMPIMDGCTAVKMIRNNQRWQKLPIIALTANVLSDEVRYYKQIGFTEHLGKPFERHDLINLVARCAESAKPEHPDKSHQ